jgi:hypothetical protein
MDNFTQTSPRVGSAAGRVRRGFVALGLLAGLSLLAGCGGGGGLDSGAKNEVNGKVTLGDKPVGGQVVFVYPDGKEAISPIAADGSYLMPDPPTGLAKVYIKPLGGAGGPKGVPKGVPKGAPEMPAEGPGGPAGVAPPRKYQSVATSGLSFEVKTGKQTFNIPLS